MIRKKKEKKAEKIIIDLDGPDGNSFILLGKANAFARQLRYSELERKILLDQMKSTDYEGLIKTFDYYFGNFVILERS
jgi:hypothetical protein